MFSRGLTQWKRQKKASPKNPLRVTFIGEPGIDSGALMKEFLTEMMAGIEEKFFEGGSTGKNLKYSITDFQNDNLSAVVLHLSVRILPMLQQMCRGLELYGLHEMVKQNQPLFQPLFVPGHFTKPDADFLMMALSPILSEVGSVKRQRESRIVNYLQDFIQSLEDEEEGSSSQESRVEDDSEQVDKTNCTKGDAEQDKITVSSFMQWITGQGHVPITSAQREKFKIHVEFDHDCQLRYGQHSLCFPLVNACSCTVTLPTQHLGTNTEFLGIMRQAVSNSREFGRS
ncbi:hypothetical protein DPX16_0232 [Anabarilius grahami]|uniref:HECT domain-containing protein n=1 Tax=Anabarilius grahami TaxID=495550 RepID=A0A3N0Z4H4_ANAGA|nr:hypothetical protein DPX16_0232 [Anabarilius grahami]